MPQKRKLFSVGDLCVDVLQEVLGKAKFNEEHALRGLDFSIGGNAANFAVIASKLGLKPVLISAIGRGFATSFLRKELAKAGLSSNLIKSKERNAFSIVAVNRRGERAIQSVKNSLNEITAKKIEKTLLPKLSPNDIVFFGGFYHLRNLRPSFLPLLKKIRRRRALVCFDTCFDTAGKWNLSPFLPYIDFLFVNDIELKHIARGGAMAKQVNALFRKGASVVAVKQAARGATIFRKNFQPKHFPSVARRVVDTTAAGDAFNAGFVFGLLHDWSLQNCMLAGNFVAARKIRGHGLVAPTTSALERFIAVNNQPELVAEKNYSAMSKTAAAIVAELLERKPNASLALPTGETPKQLYKILTSKYKRREISFAKAKFFALDEYAGLSPKDKNSFSRYLTGRFLSKVNAKRENISLLNGTAPDLKRETARHEAAIQKQGIDLCILGIGRNGHVAFNEPGACPYGITRVVKLKKETRKVNGKNFSGGLAPSKALTIGLGTIRENSAQILLLANGRHKARAIAATLRSKDFMKWPAVALRSHRNFVFVVDRAAASR